MGPLMWFSQGFLLKGALYGKIQFLVFSVTDYVLVSVLKLLGNR